MRTRFRFVPAFIIAATALGTTAGCDTGGGPASPSAPTAVTTPAPTPTSLGISGTPSFTGPGQSVQLSAIVSMSDGSSRDVTSVSLWQSSNSAVASVSSGGLVTSVGGGACEISAAYQGLRAARQVSVSAPIRSCAFSLSETQVTFERDGGTRSVNVLASEGTCTWQATASAGWIQITGGWSGTGNGTTAYRVDANTTGITREAVINVAGIAVTVRQTSDAATSTCRYCPTATSQTVGRSGGQFSFAVRPIASDIEWTAVSNQPWIRVISGARGLGVGTVTVSVDANGYGVERTGEVSVGGLSGLFQREVVAVLQRP